MVFALKYHLVTARVCLAGLVNYNLWLTSTPSFQRWHCISQSMASSSWHFKASVPPVCLLCLQPRGADPTDVLSRIRSALQLDSDLKGRGNQDDEPARSTCESVSDI